MKACPTVKDLWFNLNSKVDKALEAHVGRKPKALDRPQTLHEKKKCPKKTSVDEVINSKFFT